MLRDIIIISLPKLNMRTELQIAMCAANHLYMFAKLRDSRKKFDLIVCDVDCYDSFEKI